MPHVNKKATSEKIKFNSNKKIRPRMSCEWIEKTDPKKSKNSKNQNEIAACEQKTTTEKPNFCSNTVFSLYFKIRAKKIHAAKPLAFSLHFLFRRDQNHHSNLTSKIMKMCEQILKKNITGRNPETTRSENLFNRHPTTH